uniref:Uncharacterized protein n=1 Tax=Romanomermis culicivorax TaxID=13658 RepID=A0A915JT55_ROMCU
MPARTTLITATLIVTISDAATPPSSPRVSMKSSTLFLSNLFFFTTVAFLAVGVAMAAIAEVVVKLLGMVNTVDDILGLALGDKELVPPDGVGESVCVVFLKFQKRK